MQIVESSEVHDVIVIVLGASAMDSTRILLNSKSDIFPNGIGNGSDQIGRNFSEQQMVHVRGYLPQLFGSGYQNSDGIGGGHYYIPRFNHRSKQDYLRGFGIQMWNTGSGTTGETVAKDVPGFGADLKAAVKKRYPSLLSLHPFGEILPRPENRVTVDESRTDRYGVSLMKISVSFGDDEKKMRRHMYDTAEEILEKAGAEVVPFERDAHDDPGSAIHEHSTCRMGADAKQSALNAFNHMHEVENLFVVDGYDGKRCRLGRECPRLGRFETVRELGGQCSCLSSPARRALEKPVKYLSSLAAIMRSLSLLWLRRRCLGHPRWTPTQISTPISKATRAHTLALAHGSSR